MYRWTRMEPYPLQSMESNGISKSSPTDHLDTSLPSIHMRKNRMSLLLLYKDKPGFQAIRMFGSIPMGPRSKRLTPFKPQCFDSVCSQPKPLTTPLIKKIKYGIEIGTIFKETISQLFSAQITDTWYPRASLGSRDNQNYIPSYHAPQHHLIYSSYLSRTNAYIP